MNVPIPERLDLIEENGNLVIRRKWFGPQFIFLAFFCVVWDGFLFFWYGAALAGDDTPWIAILFPIGHLAVGLWLTYYTIAGFLNKTDIIINALSLEVKHYPLKWMGNKVHEISDIKQLYTTETQSNNRNNSTVQYAVKLILQNGKSQKLVSGLENKEQGLFIENKIEEILGISDEEVLGEVK